MCGICGKYYFNTDRQVESVILNNMTHALQGRGPDQQGQYIHGHAGIGVRRLSILDIPGGRQPVFNESGTVVAVLNGEIYNYPELKMRLLKKGHLLKTRCDSEAIPHLYEEYGVELFHELEGMFALAVFDVRKNMLIVGRDRFGVKPLYYSQSADALRFASSLTALLADPDIPRAFDIRGINAYFSYNYFPEDFSPCQGVKKLLPGHLLLCSPQGVRQQVYWELPAQEARNGAGSSAPDKLDAILEEVVKSYLASDVPVGIFLSAGLDSSALVYYARKCQADVRTFTMGFDDPTFDERDYARRLSQFFNTRHQEAVIKENIPGLVSEMVEAMDTPLGEPSFLPTLKLSEYAKQSTGVVLSGEGANELFGGYQTYRADLLAQQYRKLPVIIRKKIIPQLVSHIPYDNSRMGVRFKSDLFLGGANSAFNSHYCWRALFSEQEKAALYPDDFLAMLGPQGLKEPYVLFETRFSAGDARTFARRALYYDTTCWLPSSILLRLDMATMHHALEARVPYLDSRVAAFAAALPIQHKISFWQTKPFLRRAFRGRLPDFVLKRSKRGFSVPIARWFRAELKEYFLAHLQGMSEEARFFVNPLFLEKLFREHVERRADHSRKLWNAMVFMLWLDVFKKRTPCV